MEAMTRAFLILMAIAACDRRSVTVTTNKDRVRVVLTDKRSDEVHDVTIDAECTKSVVVVPMPMLVPFTKPVLAERP